MTPEETTEVVDQQVSLQDDIQSAFDEQTSTSEGDDVSRETIEEPVKTDTEIEPLLAVERWDAGLKDTFNSWNDIEHGRDYQQAMLDYHTQQQGYHTKLEQEISPLRKESESWNGVFDPHREFMMHNGLNPQDAARRGVGIMANIASDPQAFALDMLQRLNYDFAKHGQDAPYVPPEVQELRKELNGFKQSQQDQLLQDRRNQANQLTPQTPPFASGKDASGNLLHPHYEAVEADMTEIVYGRRGAGKPDLSLEDLYKAACSRNPDIQAQAKAEEIAQDTARKAAKAKKAKEAATRVTGKHVGESESNSLRDDLDANYDKLAT